MSIKTKTITVNHVSISFLLLVGSWIVGDFIGAVISYLLHPWLQYNHSMFIAELFSFGSLISSMFVLLVYVPALAVLFFSTKYLAVWKYFKSWHYSFFSVVPLVLASLARQHLFEVNDNWFIKYIFDTTLAGVFFWGVMVFWSTVKKNLDSHNAK